MANSEQGNEFNALVTERDEYQSSSLTQQVKELIRDKRRVLKDKMQQPLLTKQCPPEIVALFMMSENVSHFSDDISCEVASYLQNNYKAKASDIKWEADKTFAVEQYLWTLYVEKATKDGCSPNNYEKKLSECFYALKSYKNPCLCMALWLASDFAPEDWLRSVQGIVEEAQENRIATWVQRDRMFFLLACVRNSNCSIEMAREIETQIQELQLYSVAATAAERIADDVCLVSPAIGLLVLIYCARRQGLKDSVVDAVRQVVRWIVGHMEKAKGKDFAWAYYALNEYVAFESETKMDTAGER